MLYYAIALGSAIIPRLPLWACYTMADGAGSIAYVTAFSARANIQRNLAVVMGCPEASISVRIAAWRAFRNNAKNWVDTLRLGSVSKEEIEHRLTVPNWPAFVESADSGEGLLLLCMHLGNIDLVGQLIAARGYKLTVPVEEMGDRRLFDRAQALRQQLGIDTVPLAQAPRKALTALKRGEVVAVLCDRRIGTAGVDVTFFGRNTTVSKGPAWMARKSKARVLIGYGVRSSSDKFAGYVHGPLELQRTDDEDADIKKNTQTIMAALESCIAQFPEQWVMFAPVWDGHG
jgi:lauroyl/myristoyl acyltransferase